MSESIKQSETPLPWSPTPPPQCKTEPVLSPPEYRRRLRYTPELKLKLSIDNQDHYLQMSSIDEFFRFIRSAFCYNCGFGPSSRRWYTVATKGQNYGSRLTSYYCSSQTTIRGCNCDYGSRPSGGLVDRSHGTPQGRKGCKGCRIHSS